MKSVSPHLSKTYKATALSLAISSADILFILLIINSFYILHFCRKNTLFLRNHQENHKKSASYQQITTKSIVNYKLLTAIPRRSQPAQPGEGFDAPPTLERSGSEHRRAVTSLALLERARAWEWVKDPPAGEGQVGLFFHNHFKCLEDKLDVIPEAGILYILQIELDFLLHDYMDVIILRISSLLH